MPTMKTSLFLVACLASLTACSSDEANDDPSPVTDPPNESADLCSNGGGVGYEILEVVSPTEIRAWIGRDVDAAGWDALELPAGGWLRNQPREGSGARGCFAHSPGATTIVEEAMFGHTWFHSATVIETGVAVDEEGLLSGSRVTKNHRLELEAGHTVVVLTSPEGDDYLRIGRDAGRTSDDPTLPMGWTLRDVVTAEATVVQLPDPTLVIRTDNEDSFQGPVPGLGS